MQSLGEIKILCKTVEIVLAEQMDEGFNPISQKLGRVSALIRFLQLRFNLRFQIYNGDGRGQTEELNSHLGISVADCLVAKQELRDAASAVAENSRSEKQLRRRHTTSLGTAEELASTLEGRQDVSEGITESSVSGRFDDGARPSTVGRTSTNMARVRHVTPPSPIQRHRT